jgi:phosphatidate cytidylyltransferase
MQGLFGEHTDRIFTGLALLLVVAFVGYIDNLFVMWLFFGAVYILAFKEAVKLFGLDGKKFTVYAVILWCVVGLYPNPDDLFMLLALAYASYVAYNKDKGWSDFLPFIYPTVGMLFIYTLYKDFGILSLVWLLIIVALSDIGAYVVGKSMGKTPFCPTSPKKTREGVFGGIAVATIFGMFFGLSMVSLETSAFISLVVSLSSIFGDLYESSLKRKAEVKDSGDLLPGHGGVLDRIDGYLFGGVVMLILLRGLV